MATPEDQYARMLAERWIASDAPDEGQVEARAPQRLLRPARIAPADAAAVARPQFAHLWQRFRANRAADFSVRARSRAAGAELRLRSGCMSALRRSALVVRRALLFADLAGR